MRAMDVIMTEALGCDRIQRGVYRVLIEGERFVAMGTADLHVDSPNLIETTDAHRCTQQSKYTTTV
jgi:hypothetical protein